MKDTRILIMEAGLKVFSRKGYLASTTKEIAEEAGFAEVTIFRHFQTKRILFEEAVKYALGESFEDEFDVNSCNSFSEFINNLLHEKLMLVSKNGELIKMLMRETLGDALPDHLQVITTIYGQIQQKIKFYLDDNKIVINSKPFGEIITGIIIRYVMMERNFIYHLMSAEEQVKYLNKYTNLLKMP